MDAAGRRQRHPDARHPPSPPQPRPQSGQRPRCRADPRRPPRRQSDRPTAAQPSSRRGRNRGSLAEWPSQPRPAARCSSVDHQHAPASTAAGEHPRPTELAGPRHLHGMRSYGSTASTGPDQRQPAGKVKPAAIAAPSSQQAWRSSRLGSPSTVTGAWARRHPRPRVIASTARTAPVVSLSPWTYNP
jgi:hypothetical protein